MRPASIRKFEILFLASLLTGLIGTLISWNATLAQFRAGAGGVELSPAILIGVLAVIYAIMLLLWYLIARRASKIAKWILVVFTLISLIGIPALFSPPFTLSKGIELLSNLLQVAAVVFLFLPDARVWFAGDKAGDPEVLQDTFE